MKKLILTILFLPVFLFSQKVDIKNISVEVKKPVKVIGAENDKTTFYIVEDIKYNPRNNLLYISDGGNNRIVVLDTDLKFVKEFGQQGQGPGEFDYPMGISIGKNNEIIIRDEGNTRIQTVNPDGEHLFAFPFFLIGPHIATDSKGQIYINSVKDKTLFSIFNNNGDLITEFGKQKKIFKDRQAQMMSNAAFPVIDKNDNLYCVFWNNYFFRKYNSEHELVFEKSLENLPEIQKSIKKKEDEIDKAKKSGKPLPGYMQELKLFVNDISVDEQYIYILTNIDGVLYLFNKNNGDLAKCLKFELPGYESCSIYAVETIHPDFLFAYDNENMLVLKFEK